MTLRFSPWLRHTGPAMLLVAATACSRGTPPAEVEIRGTDPNAGTSVAAAPAGPAGPSTAPNAQGIVNYEGYQTVVAGEDETVAHIADRVGLSASELASYNGLTPAHRMRAGDELVLPARPGGYGAGSTAVGLPPAPGTPGSETIVEAPLPAPADTASEPAPPPGAWSPALAEAAIDRSTGINPDGSLGAPPSSAEPVPPEPEPRRALASPDLGQYQTGSVGIPAAVAPPVRPGAPAAPETSTRLAEANPNLRMQKPVEGPVAIGFNKGAGPARNDGVDFAAPAGSPVVAAADGEVALVSQSLGGLGTIVLVRHPDDLLTVYGRVDGVSVAKGDSVERGQQIGVVSQPASGEPRMHFEVRRGAESLDPMQFL